jgi:GINS complex subunit 1
VGPEEGGSFGVQSSQAGNESSLSPEEEEYFRQYCDMLATYKGQWTDIDLTGSLEPPKDLFIDVRVLRDAGEIQTEYGYVLPTYTSLGFLFRLENMSLDWEVQDMTATGLD